MTGDRIPWTVVLPPLSGQVAGLVVFAAICVPFAVLTETHVAAAVAAIVAAGVIATLVANISVKDDMSPARFGKPSEKMILLLVVPAVVLLSALAVVLDASQVAVVALSLTTLVLVEGFMLWWEVIELRYQTQQIPEGE